MHRIFGTSKPPPPKPTLNDALHSLDSRAQTIDQKIFKLDEDLKKMRDQMARMPEGAAKNAMKQRALRLLKQKKLYESQRDQALQQSFNIEQAHMASQSLQTTLQAVDVMKQTSVEMKKQYKKMDINKIEDVRDDLEDLMEQANEIQEVMSRSYGLPDGLDEDDLEAVDPLRCAELAALGDDLGVQEAAPSYLDDTPSVPTTVPTLSSTSGGVKAGVAELQAPPQQEVDELPSFN